ncbi:polysaccharide biosynthesis/export family protein [Pseudomonas sp. TNT3]|jgi:polysaccharide export outer membrane protein|uniref:polysaccharide biosynthesis/export family protein n=1 Tax=Pseudomonas sp. TNT3 TaxID=2654097 RepID=UPI001390A033|nr:polysaccharide biosynthesis/export family protein [Pseudomonas sp. TNT3]KAI2689537.1 polysaccharide biosynthesis/export family protein [Pseudomonas sp. TNT3]
MNRALPLAMLVGLTLQGCIFSPGQHMDTGNLVREGSPESSRIELIPITPKLMAIETAADHSNIIAPELLRFQPSEYRIGAGDLIYITVWDHPELTAPSGPQQQIEANGRLVRPDGSLFYPYVGNIEAAGKTIEDLRSIIASRLAKVVAEPQVDVSILRFVSQKVVLSGAFGKTGQLPITNTPLSLLDAVGQGSVQAGSADISGLVLKRDGREYVIDLDTLNRKNSTLHNLYLKDGDQLHLPYNDQKKVYLLGEVTAARPLLFKGTNMNLTDALGSVGGLRQETSSGKEVYVIRGVENLADEPVKVFQIDLKSPSAFALAQHFKLKPQDVVYVGPADVTRWNRFISQVFPTANLLRTGVAIQDDMGSEN